MTAPAPPVVLFNQPRPIGAPPNAKAYPNPTMQAFLARRPIGVGGVADAVGTAVGILEIVGTVAVILVGADILLKWAGHPLHHGRR